MGMKNKTAFLSTVAAVMLTGSAAWAAPIPGVPPFSKLITQTDFETLVTCATDGSGICPGSPGPFQGVGLVSTVSEDGTFLNRTYGTGAPNPPPFLYNEFSGFTVRHIDAPTGSADGKIFLTGGELNYYTFPGPLAVPDNTPASAQIALIKTTGTPWLTLTPSLHRWRLAPL